MDSMAESAVEHQSAPHFASEARANKVHFGFDVSTVHIDEPVHAFRTRNKSCARESNRSIGPL